MFTAVIEGFGASGFLHGWDAVRWSDGLHHTQVAVAAVAVGGTHISVHPLLLVTLFFIFFCNQYF